MAALRLTMKVVAVVACSLHTLVSSATISKMLPGAMTAKFSELEGTVGELGDNNVALQAQIDRVNKPDAPATLKVTTPAPVELEAKVKKVLEAKEQQETSKDVPATAKHKAAPLMNMVAAAPVPPAAPPAQVRRLRAQPKHGYRPVPRASAKSTVVSSIISAAKAAVDSLGANADAGAVEKAVTNAVLRLGAKPALAQAIAKKAVKDFVSHRAVQHASPLVRPAQPVGSDPEPAVETDAEEQDADKQIDNELRANYEPPSDAIAESVEHLDEELRADENEVSSMEHELLTDSSDDLPTFGETEAAPTHRGPPTLKDITSVARRAVAGLPSGADPSLVRKVVADAVLRAGATQQIATAIANKAAKYFR